MAIPSSTKDHLQKDENVVLDSSPSTLKFDRLTLNSHVGNNKIPIENMHPPISSEGNIPRTSSVASTAQKPDEKPEHDALDHQMPPNRSPQSTHSDRSNLPSPQNVHRALPHPNQTPSLKLMQPYRPNGIPMAYNNPMQKQPSTPAYYSDRPPLAPQYQYRQGSAMSPPQSLPTQQQMVAPMSPQINNGSVPLNYRPQSQPLPPPPPNHSYYGPRPPIAPYGQPPRPPPQYIPDNAYIPDNTYLSDSSLSAAYSAGKRPPKKSKFPPATKENLAKFRNEANQSNDPRLQLDFAKFLLEAIHQVHVNEHDPKRTKKACEALIMEAQKIVKKLASHSGMGKQGYPEAQFFLANCYGTGAMGLATDSEKAFSLYVQGSKQNHPGCTFRAAVCYEVGAGTKRDKNHAMQFYRKAANLGDPIAMYKLGMILLKGFLSQPKNPREGISWLKRAAQQADEDHPHALHELGLAYEKEGIPSVIPDLNYARELFTQAAQYGYAPSQFKLGQAYENGFLNCPVDPRRSIAWYSKAAEQGEVEAEFALSGWYLTGADGILPQNDGEAYLWARKAADRGYAKAEYAVGYYTETGTGTKQDLEEAKRWYMRAAAQNYTRAMQRLTEIKYGGARPQQRRKHTREDAKEGKDSECNIM
ncbi:hypothetical protein G6F46_006898 [Rhizopus delemar]|nr:hypothetical protein G6F55_007051 [Rhizopus delemar]KAG1552238.1 hypothetical protein G6F51_001359 [Rhizopus arrhizus]KAG1494343.1 hypothetical protein G6F54_007941 [Rhizopus delemar]KAG1508175.1 hypothetical protein G6F53_008394 [Rhizopus delemar]KAG1523894.1 hypothetical protein G6F52_004643 [Rhizopus delemar]